MESLTVIISLIATSFCIALFVKLWKLTEDVKFISKVLILNSDPLFGLIASLKPGTYYKFPFGEAEFRGMNYENGTLMFFPASNEAKEFGNSCGVINNEGVINLSIKQFKALYDKTSI